MKKIHLVVLFLAFVFSSCTILRTDQDKIDALVNRMDRNETSLADIKYLRGFFNDLTFFGGFLYPEASKIMKHYISGDGSDLEIKSKYFYKSPVITVALAANKDKADIGPITLEIDDDPRIAYAVNGFRIKNDPENMEIYQRIEFAGRNDRENYTVFTINKNTIRVPDRLIRVFEQEGGCKAFTVRISRK
jgi:hypothetical protein